MCRVFMVIQKSTAAPEGTEEKSMVCLEGDANHRALLSKDERDSLGKGKQDGNKTWSLTILFVFGMQFVLLPELLVFTLSEEK